MSWRGQQNLRAGGGVVVNFLLMTRKNNNSLQTNQQNLHTPPSCESPLHFSSTVFL